MSTRPDKPSAQPTQALNMTEHSIAEIWREVLQTSEQLNATDNFFDLGGDSMTMTMVEFRIKEELNIELASGAILGAPSLRQLSALIDAKRADSPSSDTK